MNAETERPAAPPSQVRRGWFRWPWVSRAEYERIIAASLVNAENDRKRMALLQSMCNNRDDTIAGMELAEAHSKQNHADIVSRLKAEQEETIRRLRGEMTEQLRRERESCIADLKTVQDQRDELWAEWVKWNADRAKIAEENATLRTDRDTFDRGWKSCIDDLGKVQAERDVAVQDRVKMTAELDRLAAETLQAKGRAQILEDERDRARAIADQNRAHVGLMRMWISELHHKVEERLCRKPPTSPVGVTVTDDREAAMGSPVVEVASTGIMAGGG